MITIRPVQGPWHLAQRAPLIRQGNLEHEVAAKARRDAVALQGLPAGWDRDLVELRIVQAAQLLELCVDQAATRLALGRAEVLP